MNASARPVTWSNWREIGSVLAQRRHVRRAALVAVTVGTAFFAMSQLGVILAGKDSLLVWVKAVLTYLTPFCVSSIGVLSGPYRPEDRQNRGGSR
jgi:hypothetical protein